VASSLETRVKRLEDAGGGGECPPCSGTTVGYVNGALKSVSKDGRRFTPERRRPSRAKRRASAAQCAVGAARR
jgi:hypothetical protein